MLNLQLAEVPWELLLEIPLDVNLGGKLCMQLGSDVVMLEVVGEHFRCTQNCAESGIAAWTQTQSCLV